MKVFQGYLFIFAAALLLALPAPTVHSQLVAPTDPMTAIQALQTANDDLIKRQEATIKDVADMTDTAREVRLFSKRG